MQDAFFQCDDIDIIAIHMYGTGDFSTSKLTPYVEKAQQANKMLMVQEWFVLLFQFLLYCHSLIKYIIITFLYRGVCYHQDSSNQCKSGGGGEDPNRKSILQKFAGTLTDAGIPWLYWQAIPNADPHVRAAGREFHYFIQSTCHALIVIFISERMGLRNRYCG